MATRKKRAKTRKVRGAPRARVKKAAKSTVSEPPPARKQKARAAKKGAAAQERQDMVPAADRPGKVTRHVASVQGSESVEFPIVGIGASAGGLEAFEAFFKAMQADSGIGFVLVPHLDPTHVSLLPQLLQKHTTMKVSQISDGMPVMPNGVHVIPPNKTLTIEGGVLRLGEQLSPRASSLPIDAFFRSLAHDQGRSAVCIILSGTGADGTSGVKAIKGEVGMVMVQDEASAKYDGMPRSAIATGLADYVMHPAQMPAQLMTYVRRLGAQSRPASSPDDLGSAADLRRIFALVRSRTDHDFSHYKQSTVKRRIERRMLVHQVDNLNEYAQVLESSDREREILFKELLIGVTSFFRDPEAFDVLRSTALPQLLAGKQDGDTVRVWVPGCSSGEESYSVAIVLAEALEQHPQHLNIQVFGTDIDADAISAARAGLYPAAIASDVERGRLKRFFDKEDGGSFRIKKRIREMLVFATQNVIKDPPFTKLDILCCRNLLIYLDSELQRRLLPSFHYSLRNDGILFLGSSETIGQARNLFAPISKKWKLFRRKPTSAPTPVVGVRGFDILPELPEPSGPERIEDLEQLSALRLVETILQQSRTPPCVVIDKASNVVYAHGRVGRYLEPAEGKATLNILQMARPSIRAELAAAISSAALHKQEVVRNGLTVQSDGNPITVDVAVRPILPQGVVRGLMMVTFEEVTNAPAVKAKRTRPGKKRGRTAAQLDLELRQTRESLQSTIEELETTNEELKSSNEELQSTNEELQSTNEELETSKEELQSLNEESNTVNAELQARFDELTTATDDLTNLMNSTEIATIFLDQDLCVRRFTPHSAAIVSLASTDLGRPLGHFATHLLEVDLLAEAEAVLADLVVRSREVSSKEGRWFTLRVRPYRTVANVIDGVVLTFEDVTDRKLAEEKLEQLHSELRLLVESNLIGFLAGEGDHVREANQAALELLGYSNEDLAVGRLEWSAITVADFGTSSVTALVAAGVEAPVEIQLRRKDGSQVSALVGGTIGAREPFRWACLIRGTTERESVANG